MNNEFMNMCDFVLEISGCYELQGRGIIINGKVLKGSVKTKDEVYFISEADNKIVMIGGIQVENKLKKSAQEGDNCSVQVFGIKKEEIHAGDCFVVPKQGKRICDIQSLITKTNCIYCGNLNDVEDKFCAGCGAKID